MSQPRRASSSRPAGAADGSANADAAMLATGGEALLRQIIASSPDCIKLLDLDGKLLSLNENGRMLLEIDDVTAWIGSCWVDWWGGPDQAQARAAVDAALAGGAGRFEALAKTAKGTPRWWDVIVTPMLGPDGVPVRLMSVSRDVTALKTAAEALAESENRERAVIESATDYAIFATDLAGLVTLWNKGAEQAFGFGADEIIGTSSDVLWPAGDRTTEPAFEREIARRSGLANDNRWHVRKSGERFYVRGMMRPIRNAEGLITGFVKICRDETERLKTETDLADARTRLGLALEAGAIATWVLDVEQNRVYGDENLRHFFDVTREQMNGGPLEPYLDAIHPEDRERVTTLIGSALASAHIYETEYRVRSAGGERWVEARGRIERDAAGRPLRLPGVLLDITRRKQAELALVVERRRLEALFDVSPAAMALWRGEDLIFEKVNPQFQALVAGRELAGRPLLEALPELAGQGFDDLLRRVLETGEPVVGHEVRARMPSRDDGPIEDRYFDFAYQRICDADGKPYGVYDHAVDVTDRVVARLKLEESEKRFRQLADAMPQIVWAAGPDGTLDYYNRRWFEYVALSEDQADAARWDHFIHPEDLPRAYESWAASVRTGSPYAIEFRVRRADGAYRWFLVRAVPVRDEAGAVARWFGTCTDIEEQKRLQAQREQLLESERAARSEAERTGKMKDEFLATLSHEIRTPLNAILGWSQIMRGSTEPADIEQGLDVIERNARAQSQIIEDLLDMSRIISGKVRLDVQGLDLVAIVRTAVNTARPTADTKGVTLTASIEPLADASISGDAARLQQVFWNLLSNAVKFTPRGGSVRVVLGRVESHLEVSVTDTGEGIKPEFLPFVFDRFRQADASTTRRHGGLGLGLSIVKQLVELHGGSVGVRSTGAGHGSRFVVALPLSAVRQSPREAGPDRAHAPPTVLSGLTANSIAIDGVRALVVDDEADARMLVKRLLEDSGGVVTTAASVAEALTALQNGPFDVLVSDIGMPGRDGYELIRLMREAGHALPAIALTAYARAEDRVKAVAAGFLMHVAKPVEPVELVTMVAAAAGRTGRR